MTVQPSPSDEDPTEIARTPEWCVVLMESLGGAGEAEAEEDEAGNNQGGDEDPDDQYSGVF